MPEALNAVIYARYSSDRQTEQSIEGQLRECYAFAKANDIAVIDTYIDRAISGKTDNRPAFQKMIEDSAKRQFQAVIVYRLDRFTRNRYDSAIYKARLKKNGVKVLSAMENLNGSPESIIMESLLEGMAEYYSVELSQKITRGMRENALKGKALGGQRVLGYKVNSDCYFEIDETTAPVVVDIFKLYSSGKTVKEICDILNARGVKTARGGAFNKNSLHTILTNKKYITESTKTRLTELEDEKRNVEIEIAKESIARRIISREQIIYWISSFKDGDITSEKYRQQLIDTFVHAVFVYDDKIVITYNYSGENNTATISDLDLSSPPF